MTLSKKLTRLILTVSLLLPAFASAEDIDLFQGGSAITGNKPNVLIIVDNSANWNRNDQGWPVGKQGESELNALKLVLGSLTGDVRVGLMMLVKSREGGYVRFGIRDMDSTNRPALQSMLASIVPVFNDQNSGQQVASANAQYGEVMYEAYKYFSGSTAYSGPSELRDYAGNGSYNVSPYTAGNLSGNAFSNSSTTTYNSPLSPSAACAKNFIIFIGNGFPSNSSTNPTAYGDATLSQFDATAIYNEGTKTTYADEWARFLYEHGAVAPCADGVCADGKIATYTIDVYKDHQDVAQTNLLKSMATVGGVGIGGYFAATSEDEIKVALTNIFNRIQAENSVFTSASLPVSVNTQGTYLNQIYMGVFRPDGAGRPRWLGNLKQYKFDVTTAADGTESIFLADSTSTAVKPKPAVDPTTGFIVADAVSFWTSPSSFWAFQGADKASDSPDGAVVEKGGAAQKLRALGPTARTMYTCTPDCTANATPPLFATTNTALVTTLTPPSSAVTLSRSGPTVTATTTSDLGLASPTDTVTISGANVAVYNSTWSVTKVDPTHFTFTVAETPVTPATGSAITVSAGSSVSQSISAGNVTYSNGTVSVNLPAHGFANNQSVTIAGANVSAAMSTATNKCTGWPATTSCEYNGTFTITKLDANNFSYTPPATNFGNNQTTAISPPDTFVPTLGTATVTCKKGSANSVDISAMTRVSGTGTKRVTAILNAIPAGCNSPLTTGNSNGDITSFSISGSDAANGISGTYTVVSAGAACATGQAKAICFDVTASNVVTSTTTITPASPATGTISATGIPTRNVTSITRSAGNASNVADVIITTETNHGFTGTSVLVSGADQTEYNGTKTVTFPTANTIKYTLTTGPTASSTGGSAARGSGVNASSLINWVRGSENKEDENNSGTLSGVRASIHGDVLHSRPVVINYGGSTGIVAFYGANDGTLHAVKAGQAGTDGVEKWAFVAPEHYSTLGRLYNNSPLIKFPNTSTGITPLPTKRDYFFDGNIGVYQSADLATTHIFVSMRRGGRFIYALDVSNPDAPKFLWKKAYNDAADSQFSELGYTWSEPKVMPIRKTAGVACSASDPTTFTRALIFGGGYDPTEEDKNNQGTAGVTRSPTMGRSVFVLDAADGRIIKRLDPSPLKFSFAGDVTLLDTDGDGCVDRVYAGDTGANLFRFDIGDADTNNWKTYKLAALGDVANDGGPDDRKFLFAPDAVLSFIDNTQVAYVLVGSGDRENPQSTTVDNKFFMIKDTVPQNSPSSVTAVGIGALTPITDFNGNTSTVDPTVSTFKGWYISLEEGEKSVNASLTIAGTTFFGTNKPKPPSATSCEPNLGIARGYAINYLNGTSAAGDRDKDGDFDYQDLYAAFPKGGLPPSPVGGVVQIGDKSYRFVIGSGGSGKTGTSIEGFEFKANPSSNRTRVFWYFKKDE